MNTNKEVGEKMKVIVTGGGTGGHIYPALAFAKYAEKEFNAEILFIGNKTRMESKVVPASGRTFFGVEMQGLNRKNMLKNILIPYKTFVAYNQIKKQMKKFKPDIVIGTGGYVTVPTLLAGRKFAKKTFVFEPDMNPGKANSFLSTRVDGVLTAFESTCDAYTQAKQAIYLGNPVALDYTVLDAKEQFTKKQITLLGGSLGAEYLNNLALAIAKDIRFFKYQIVVITGERFFEKVSSKLASFENVKVKAYEEDIVNLYEATTMLVSRSGATTVSEVLNKALPTIFIPSPHVANNEQFDNVQSLLKNEACEVFEESKTEESEVLECLASYLEDFKKYEQMSENLKKQSSTSEMSEKMFNLFSI